jgi:hypothetical protein
MTPKEKAREIVIKMQFQKEPLMFEQAKQCALIAVDEILGEYQSMSDLESVLVINNKLTFIVHKLVYWIEVKQEIENI